MDFSTLKLFCLQAPPKLMFTERGENYGYHRRMLYKYITDTSFLKALTAQELGCNLLSGANPIRGVTKSDAGCYVL